MQVRCVSRAGAFLNLKFQIQVYFRRESANLTLEPSQMCDFMHYKIGARPLGLELLALELGQRVRVSASGKELRATCERLWQNNAKLEAKTHLELSYSFSHRRAIQSMTRRARHDFGGL